MARIARLEKRFNPFNITTSFVSEETFQNPISSFQTYSENPNWVDFLKPTFSFSIWALEIAGLVSNSSNPASTDSINTPAGMFYLSAFPEPSDYSLSFPFLTWGISLNPLSPMLSYPQLSSIVYSTLYTSSCRPRPHCQIILLSQRFIMRINTM